MGPEKINPVLAALAAVAKAHPEMPDKGTGGRDPGKRAVALNNLAASTGTPYNTLCSRAKAVEKQYPAHWRAAMKGQYQPVEPPANDDAPGAPEKPEKRPRSLDEDVALHRAQETARDATGRLREARGRIAALEDELADYRAAAASSARPAAWTLKPSAHSREHIPYLFTSDFQIGEVIRAEETGHAHGYDVGLFKTRYRRLIETTIDLCLTHQSGWTYPGMVYARGGDTISGAIHDELLETDEVTPIEAVEIAFEEEAAGILKLADAFGRVDVKCVPGNHDRDTRKPQSKKAGAHSYERLITYMLQREFRHDDRVTFQTSLSPDVYFAIYNTRILLTHGDKIGSRGGQGFVGPAATIMRGAQKVILEQQNLGRPVDEVHMGHFHTALELGYALANGCLPGYSEYAKMNRLRPEAPSQWLGFYHPRYGKVALKKVWLEEPRPAGLDWLDTAA